MFDEILEQFRQQYDTAEMDAAGCLPVFQFKAFHHNGNKIWQEIPAEFFGNDVFEIVKEAREEIGTNEGLILIKPIKACDYYLDSIGEMHVILTKAMLAKIKNANVKRSKTQKQFANRILHLYDQGVIK